MRFALFLLAFLFALPALAQEDLHVNLRLHANTDAAVPSKPLKIAVEQVIAPGWHTYWLNPGDSGEPMRIKWDLPPGYKASDFLWPAPDRVPYGPLVNFGYTDQAVMLADISVPRDAKPGDTLPIRGEATVLVCDEICIPETMTIAMDVPVAQSANIINADFFQVAGMRIPQPVDWETVTELDANEVRVRVNLPPASKGFIDDPSLISWFPYEWGYVENASSQLATHEDVTGTLTLRQKRSAERDISHLKTAAYVVDNGSQTFIVSGPVKMAGLPMVGDGVKLDYENIPLIGILALAFLGGLILNLMPCVFPVLSMKALHLVSLPKHERKSAGAAGLLYAAGVVTTFLGLGALLFAVRAAGESVGWGFQLQNPAVIAGLAWLMFIVGLNLAGMFDLRVAFGGEVILAERHHPLVTSFLTGVLATLVATPCSAPFMATAVGAALAQSMPVALMIFTCVGIGLAFPYVLLCFVPALQRILPKPGAWMEIFRQVLAFPMFATAVWLVWVVAQQGGPQAVMFTLSGMVALAFSIWLLDRKPATALARRMLMLGGIVVGALTLASLALVVPQKDPAITIEKTVNWKKFDTRAFEHALNETDEPLFVNMTAAWCITCLFNERTTLDTPELRGMFADNNVTYLKGDWTNRDQAITSFLQSFGRSGVPIYVYWGPRDPQTGDRPAPVVLPQILTAQIFRDLFQ